MSLTKQAAELHRAAAELVALDRPLTRDEEDLVLENWRESSTNRLDGAFFTPMGLARDMSWEVVGDRVIDLCAGTGRLAAHCVDSWGVRSDGHAGSRELVCVERNPEYVKVGHKTVPEAAWFCADLFDLPEGLGLFDTAICNPPFGSVKRTGDGPGYQGRRFEYHALAVASRIARRAVFLIPQESAPSQHSGLWLPRYERSAELEQFERQTGIRLEVSTLIDTAQYLGEWHGAAPRTEVVVCNFTHPAPPESAPVLPAPPARSAQDDKPGAELCLF
jgi:hypothetical protein